MSNESDSTEPEIPRRQLLLLAILFEGGLAVAACLLGWWWNVLPWEHWKWDWLGVGQGLLLTLPILIGFLLFLRKPIGPLRRIKRFMDDFARPMFAACTLGDLAVVSILAGLGEEFLFRGVLQPALGEWLGLWGGLAAASVLFGLVHPITPMYVVLAAAIGAYLGWAYIVMENIVPCVVAHALYDFLALAIVTRSKTHN